MEKLTNPEAFQLEAAAILAAGYSVFPSSFGWSYDADSDMYPTDTGPDSKFSLIRSGGSLIMITFMAAESSAGGG